MSAPAFDALVDSVRIPSLLMSPINGGTNDALALRVEQLANVATALASRPAGRLPRTIALEAAYHRAYAVARVLPELLPYEHPGWVLSEATAAIEAIERCRAEVRFPIAVDDLLIALRSELDAFAHARANAA
jgi:hypothetical protein